MAFAHCCSFLSCASHACFLLEGGDVPSTQMEGLSPQVHLQPSIFTAGFRMVQTRGYHASDAQRRQLPPSLLSSSRGCGAGTELKRGVIWAGSTWPTAKLDTIAVVPPLSCKLSVNFSQAMHTFNLFERNSNCIFIAVSCIFYL